MIRKISPLILAAFMIVSAVTVWADTISIIATDDDGTLLTATMVCEFNSQTNTITFTITNTSHITDPTVLSSSITAIGFDLPPLGNASRSGLNGFTGSQAPSTSSDFNFSDAAVGRVPGFNSATLDFAFLTGKNFSGGNSNAGIENGESASFTVSGAAFAGFTEEQICNSVFVRFQGYDDEDQLALTGVPGT